MGHRNILNRLIMWAGKLGARRERRLMAAALFGVLGSLVVPATVEPTGNATPAPASVPERIQAVRIEAIRQHRSDPPAGEVTQPNGPYRLAQWNNWYNSWNDWRNQWRNW
jgi:hypothetical protein